MEIHNVHAGLPWYLNGISRNRVDSKANKNFQTAKSSATLSRMITPRLGVVVGIPCSRPVMPEWAVALATQNWPTNTNVMYAPIRGLPVDQARTLIVESALKLEAPYIWMVDDDVEMPLGTCRQLLQTIKQADDKVMVVGGIYTSRQPPPEPIVYRGNGVGCFWKWKKDTIFECTLVGTGCMMIKTEVFQYLEKPWFKTVDDHSGKITDDAWFCDRVTSAGYKILADGHILCVHWDNAQQIGYRLPEDSYPMIPEAESSPIKSAESDLLDKSLVEQYLDPSC